MASQETIYAGQLNRARLAARQQELTQEKESKVPLSGLLNFVEAALIIGIVAFLGNDVIDWIWGLIDLGTSGVALALDWTVNNGLNFITAGIISFWLALKGLKPDVLQKALIGVVVALVLDSLPFVGFIPVFTIQTTATIIIVNYWEKIAAKVPGGEMALKTAGGKIRK